MQVHENKDAASEYISTHCVTNFLFVFCSYLSILKNTRFCYLYFIPYFVM
jgi:hypothetical protein